MIPQQMRNWGLPDPKPDANCAPHLLDRTSNQPPSGRSSGVEHNLAKVGVEGSNPFARSNFIHIYQYFRWTHSP